MREILNFESGLIDGTRILINKKGKIIEQENYSYNKLHGLQKYFHDTGKLKWK